MGDIDIMNDNDLRGEKNFFDYFIKSIIMLKLYDIYIEILKLEYNKKLLSFI